MKSYKCTTSILKSVSDNKVYKNTKKNLAAKIAANIIKY